MSRSIRTVRKPTADWMMRFLEQYDLEHQKMKCEEGTEEYAAIQPWITEWLRSLTAVLHKS